MFRFVALGSRLSQLTFLGVDFSIDAFQAITGADEGSKQASDATDLGVVTKLGTVQVLTLTLVVHGFKLVEHQIAHRV